MKVSRMPMQLVCVFTVATAGSVFAACSSSTTGSTGGAGGGTTTTATTGTTAATTGTTAATTGTTAATTGTTAATTTAATTGTAASSSSGTTASASSTTSTAASSSSGTTASASSTTAASSSAASTTAASSSSSSSGSACTTTIAALDPTPSDAGLAPLLLWSFDPGSYTSLSSWGSFYNGGDANLTATTPAVVAADGVTCPPALGQTFTFALAGDGPIMQWAGAAQNWTGRTKLHIHLKIVTTNYTDLSFVQGAMSAGGFYSGGFTNVNPTFADGKFHEIVVPLAPAANPPKDLTMVTAYGIQLGTVKADAGAPAPATLEMDDIWLE